MQNNSSVGEDDAIDDDINRFPNEMTASVGFEHLNMSQSVLLNEDQDNRSRRSSEDIYDDTGDDSKTLVMDERGKKAVYDKSIDSIIVNIEMGPQRLNNKLILGCISDMDWKIYSQ